MLIRLCSFLHLFGLMRPFSSVCFHPHCSRRIPAGSCLFSRKPLIVYCLLPAQDHIVTSWWTQCRIKQPEKKSIIDELVRNTTQWISDNRVWVSCVSTAELMQSFQNSMTSNKEGSSYSTDYLLKPLISFSFRVRLHQRNLDLVPHCYS